MSHSSARRYEGDRGSIAIRPLLVGVYVWMTIGLLLTAFMSFVTLSSRTLLGVLYNPIILIGLFIVQLVLVGVLSAMVRRLSFGVAAAIFAGYAILSGFTLTTILMAYDVGVLTSAFVTASAVFASMAAVGTLTRLDLTRLRTYLIMAVFGLILAMVVNIFFRSSAIELGISILGVLVFSGLTAADTQKIVRMSADPALQNDTTGLLPKLSLLGALTLYLDFLNLFIYLVRLLGRNRD